MHTHVVVANYLHYFTVISYKRLNSRYYSTFVVEKQKR